MDPRLRGDKLAPADAGVQWTGASPVRPVPDSENWQQLDYKYDVYGRRSEKIIDGYGIRYLYDGPHVIAEHAGGAVRAQASRAQSRDPP